MACSTGMKNGVNMAASCQMDETPFPGCLNYQPWRVPKRSNGTVNKFHGLIACRAFFSESSTHSKASLSWNSEDLFSPTLFQKHRRFSSFFSKNGDLIKKRRL